jgi:hypothetical protein
MPGCHIDAAAETVGMMTDIQVMLIVKIQVQRFGFAIAAKVFAAVPAVRIKTREGFQLHAARFPAENILQAFFQFTHGSPSSFFVPHR